MGDGDGVDAFQALINIVTLIASPIEEQEFWLRSHDEPLDEIRIQFEDLSTSLLPLYRESRLVDAADEIAITELDEHLRHMAHTRLMYDWTLTKETGAWRRAQDLASELLVLLQRPPSEKRPIDTHPK
ncbi:MAG TPA: hypothetical protein VG246_01290 [Acidimicrobiales bacterium]|jgi:hypothetical protein|nr:hypothetical protein [Acidimicrobiales bacterium]